MLGTTRWRSADVPRGTAAGACRSAEAGRQSPARLFTRSWFVAQASPSRRRHCARRRASTPGRRLRPSSTWNGSASGDARGVGRCPPERARRAFHVERQVQSGRLAGIPTRRGHVGRRARGRVRIAPVVRRRGWSRAASGRARATRSPASGPGRSGGSLTTSRPPAGGSRPRTRR